MFILIHTHTHNSCTSVYTKITQCVVFIGLLYLKSDMKKRPTDIFACHLKKKMLTNIQLYRSKRDILDQKKNKKNRLRSSFQRTA